MDLASKLFKGDRVIWILFMFFCLVSLVEVFSATSTLAYKHANHWVPIARHASFLVGGFVLILVIHNFPCKVFSLLVLLLPVSIVLLLLAPYIGEDINGTTRWIRLFGIQFQPSELAKLSLIVFTAFMLSLRNRYTDKQIYKTILIAAGITCGIIFGDNISTAVMLFGVCYLMMFIGQLPLKRMLRLGAILFVGLVVFLVLLYITPVEHIRKMPDWLRGRLLTGKGRIERTVHPAEELVDANGVVKITDDHRQEIHAKIAIARGGVIGRMPGHGQQRDFLPQAYSDFIYAIIIEELGFAGGIVVLLLYLTLLFRVGIIARRCEKPFPRFLVLGCGLMIVVQALANMAVAVDLIPVTGQPLPLISRGGTSTLITCVYFGIILSISRFGAGMGDEEDEPEEDNVLHTDMNEQEIESVLASIEVETLEEANV
ncbi:cell division protein FtsW [Parabacteroides sp. PFB2-12]|uniref:FtsW/RodA/SpoVE family cell cycle protein n=1 Tax=unclassified Parabacteroides TaxID=2649774 RepID=UPI002474BB8E|nr:MULTISPECIES: FtsW/RodA/SpoVE family cell cycle protein [unclassified Parabacteroides]MDH6342180.1 cell division protein FtsW [Parabacteroides sp. PM6-13]MDH6391136.1 cell division protein FtsW [Parabacteroides sp. PFB2-12]